MKRQTGGKSSKRDARFGVFSFFTGAGFFDLGGGDAGRLVFNAEAQRQGHASRVTVMVGRFR